MESKISEMTVELKNLNDLHNDKHEELTTVKEKQQEYVEKVTDLQDSISKFNRLAFGKMILKNKSKEKKVEVKNTSRRSFSNMKESSSKGLK